MSVTPADMKIASAIQRSHSGPSKMLCQNINATTTGTAASGKKGRRLGSGGARAGSVRELIAFMPRRNTQPAVRSTGHSDQIPADYDRFIELVVSEAGFSPAQSRKSDRVNTSPLSRRLPES